MFVKNILAPIQDIFQRPAVQALVDEAVGGSKLALLWADGRVSTIGEFHKDDELLFSNLSWKGCTGRYLRGGYSCVGDEWDGNYTPFSGGYTLSEETAAGRTISTYKNGTCTGKTFHPYSAIEAKGKAIVGTVQGEGEVAPAKPLHSLTDQEYIEMFEVAADAASNQGSKKDGTDQRVVDGTSQTGTQESTLVELEVETDPEDDEVLDALEEDECSEPKAPETLFKKASDDEELCCPNCGAVLTWDNLESWLN